MQKIESYLGWKVDFEHPRGAPAFCGPNSVSWRIFKNPFALAIGGIAAVLLEFADARIRSGVWDHSTYKDDPIGRSHRTGMAALIGVYGPQDAARRVVQGVTNMHARVSGETPGGERYRALDPALLDWVAATASYGFITAYDRFVTRLGENEKRSFYIEAQPVARLYGVETPLTSDADFDLRLRALLPRFAPHPIIGEFLASVEHAPRQLGLPRTLGRAVARAAVAILPSEVRERLKLGAGYDLSPLANTALRTMAALAERAPILSAPPAQACRRLGLPGNFLYRSRSAQAHMLAHHAVGA
jgi:uncharacterized protein (DUF2236 family)